ncbi:DNA cytosine methyltransferase [Paenibacillus campinasensis]|uniref:DNA (cytosine-5-)-methyltransferase n=1 Tax=Paenibacillus campinasensis TaxID=66347 RepID=A0A268EI63_9BACL|nr:DNA cytosine methyltransferase [Paenibacillus campinasensis]PAD72810.1 hypothetical protein CHH67_21110 [Paenibacillus campinasensis]
MKSFKFTYWRKRDVILSKPGKDTAKKISILNQKYGYDKDYIGEITVDNFAGGGGASTGMERALGCSVDIAINHDRDAIAMHKKNHPHTKHYCENVWEVDPLEAAAGRPIGLGWFSPDCKHFSKAKGGRPVQKNIRGLAWVMVKWCGKTHMRMAILENVEEFTSWGPLIAKRDPQTGRVLKVDGSVAAPGEVVAWRDQQLTPDPKRKGKYFRDFIRTLKKLGYAVEWRELRARDYGAPTSRKRLILMARCDGKPIVWPKETHGHPDSPQVKSGKMKPWRTAAEIIDWSIPCPSIFDRKRPLADNTQRRIAKGIEKFVLNDPNPYILPFVIKVNHQGEGFRGQSIQEPMQTITSKNGWGVVTPFVARIGQTGFGGDRLQYPVTNPLTTITTKNEHLLVNPVLIQMGYGERKGQEPRVLDLSQPIGTITAGGNKFGIAEAILQSEGEAALKDIEDRSLNVAAFLMQYNGASIGQRLDQPINTITTKDRFGIVVVIHGVPFRIVDIGFRMLEPHELFAAMGFPDSYIINIDADGRTISKSQQVARCGNSVPPALPEALVRANLPHLCTGAGTRLTFERYRVSGEGQMEFSI